MCGWQVKLCDGLVTRGPYLSALEIRSLYIKRYINLPSLLFTFTLSVIQFQIFVNKVFINDI